MTRSFLALLLVGLFVLPATAALAQPRVQLHLSGVLLVKDANGHLKETPMDKVIAKKGDLVRYTILATNAGTQPALKLTEVGPVPSRTAFVAGSAEHLAGTTIEYTLDGKTWSTHPTVMLKTPKGLVKRAADPTLYTSVRWVFRGALEPRKTVSVAYQVRVK